MPILTIEKGQRWRVGALAVIAAVVVAVAVRGRGGGPIPLATALKATTGGAFYHWKQKRGGEGKDLAREGWCALRRSRTLKTFYGYEPIDREERRSPSGIYRQTEGEKGTFEPRGDAVGMEEGKDILTETAIRLSGRNAVLRPLGSNRWQGGSAIYTLEPRTAQILKIESPETTIVVDYPLALSSDLFEAPR